MAKITATFHEGPGHAKMPPVAGNGIGDVIDALIDEGANGIESVNELGRRLHALAGRQSEKSWQTTVKRYRRTTNPKPLTERDARLIARAFDVPRNRLPAVPEKRSPTVRLEELVTLVERHGALLENLTARVEELERGEAGRQRAGGAGQSEPPPFPSTGLGHVPS